MNLLFRLFFIFYCIAKLVMSSNVLALEVIIVLLITSSILYRDKFHDSILLILAEVALISYGCAINKDIVILYGLSAYDFTYRGKYAGVGIVLLLGCYFLSYEQYPMYTFIIILCIYFSYIKLNLEKKEEMYRKSYDTERQYRYELEQVKTKLINSSKEIAHITEVRERNRIAREIHDNVGHSIAGILMQLQAAAKLWNKDADKSQELLSNSIAALTNTLTVLRETVHNIKPTEKLGVEYIKNIINNFIYCAVNFDYNGDFNILPSDYIEILYSNIKEALTNASRHSRATEININIDINPKFTRLYIKDNGIGCTHIKEGLGISGMKERIKNIGGNISISSDNGFLIVCMLPIAASQKL